MPRIEIQRQSNLNYDLSRALGGEILTGKSSNSLKWIFESVLVNPIAPVINTLRNKVRDRSEPTKIGYKILQNGQKLIEFDK